MIYSSSSTFREFVGAYEIDTEETVFPPIGPVWTIIGSPKQGIAMNIDKCKNVSIYWLLLISPILTLLARGTLPQTKMLIPIR